ncbi:MAG: alpha-mannosidase, partial [Pauljensenia sp.]
MTVDHAAQVLARLKRLEGQWLRPALETEPTPVALAAWEAPGEPVPFAEATAHEYVPTATGDPWSHPWGTTWLHLTGAVPAHWSGLAPRSLPQLVIDLGFTTSEPGFQAEGTLYRADGTVVRGLEPLNHRLRPEEGVDGSFEYWVEAASNPDVQNYDWTTPSTLGDPATAGSQPLYRLGPVELRLRDTEVEGLLADLEVLRGVLGVLDPTRPRFDGILLALSRAMDALDPDDVAGSAPAARAVLRPALERHADASAHTVHAVGHAHIDSAWLWPLRETRRKVARSFSNALDLMDADPTVAFAASSAQQYAWLKEDHPDVFERIRERVAEGRWIPVGGQWVESDPYMVGGEAFIRQFLEGTRFFREEFGTESEGVWLPDSFGYSANLPGIARHMGRAWMLTQKLSWNDTNTFPHHTFWWEGIDGTRLFTHFPPVDTYNSQLTPAETDRAQSALRQGGRATVSLAPFGWGDGGGGPTREQVERAHRQEDLEGVPHVRLSTPGAFFADALEEATGETPAAPTWLGELYLENHRGVLTSQHRTKRGNRRCEHLLREAELWATTASVREGVTYPHERLHEAWRTLLLLQFHDILPGSSITWVHREAEEMYARLESDLEDLIASSLDSLTGPGQERLLVNSGPFALDGVRSGVVVRAGTARAASRGGDLGPGVAPAPGACAAAHVTPTTTRAAALVVADGPGGTTVVDNGVLRLVVGADGLVTSLVELSSGRELVPAGETLARLHLRRDIPSDWDAWNTDLADVDSGEILTSAESVEVTVDEGGALVRVVRRHRASTFTQELRLGVGSRRLDITTEVDWHERHKLLKVEFPLALLADHAQSEVQFGHVTRPIHTNTSWDVARFETVALRWVRVAEGDFGVAVGNAETYGHSFRRLHGADGPFVEVGESLLRAPTAPDPDADQGHHVLRTSLAVGASTGDAVREGYRLNLPLRTATGSREVPALVSTTGGSGVIEAVKMAEDGSGDVVVRLYESLGQRGRTTVELGFPADTVLGVDGTERPPAAPSADVPDGRVPDRTASTPGCDGPRPAHVEWVEGTQDVEVELGPFQIATVR